MRMPQQWSWYAMLWMWCIALTTVHGNPMRLLRPLCGNELNQMLATVCGGVYYAGRKASHDSRRYARGIVEECCLESCTVADLSHYCSDDVSPSEVFVGDSPAALRADAVGEDLSVDNKAAEEKMLVLPLRFDESQVGTVSPEYMGKSFIYSKGSYHQSY